MKPHGAGAGSQGSRSPVREKRGRNGGNTNLRATGRQQVQERVHNLQQSNTNITEHDKTINIMFQNINGLPIQAQHPKNESVRDTMLRHNIDILGISEVNIAWHKVRGKARLGEQTAEWFEARHLTQAWNQTDQITEQSQFGGVALITRDKPAHCVSEQGADTTGLGRWAWT